MNISKVYDLGGVHICLISFTMAQKSKIVRNVIISFMVLATGPAIRFWVGYVAGPGAGVFPTYSFFAGFRGVAIYRRRCDSCCLSTTLPLSQV